MIKRADFALNDSDDQLAFEQFNTIPARELMSGGLTGSILRKPDFQRETNHWTPDQVVSLLECYINGDLIPSVILWRSPTYLFVIDGGHRLSVLKAWMEDDYGDGQISHKMFGHDIPAEQRRAAERTRRLVKERVNTWSYYKSLQDDDEGITKEQRTKLLTLTSRGLQVQWVQGNADKAEASFFNINMKGTPLDDLEELLLRNRKKPVPIASRAIIRAGRGHKYWSQFSESVSSDIEKESKKLSKLLFSPEISRPVKTLDLPLGGSKGVRTAIRVLIDFILFANRKQQSDVPSVESFQDDYDGELTLSVMKKITVLASRITGNDKGSLGLHPAIYYYGPSGRHSTAMFLGTSSLIAEKIINNDKGFFKKFTVVRGKLESLLIENKDLIATILQKNISKYRVSTYHVFLNNIISALDSGGAIGEKELIRFSGLEGKIIAGDFKKTSVKIGDDTKSKVFIDVALRNGIKCSICGGYIDVEKSVSYDHIEPIRDGGRGSPDNTQLTHPYCNQSVKQ
jgi:hypothetical protein